LTPPQFSQSAQRAIEDFSALSPIFFPDVDGTSIRRSRRLGKSKMPYAVFCRTIKASPLVSRRLRRGPLLTARVDCCSLVK
jgi:hypothetical protein